MPVATDIDSMLQEDRVYPPTDDFVSRARVSSMSEYRALWDRAAGDPESFWGEMAAEELHWFRPFDQVMAWDPPYAEWFVGGRTNVAFNCLDRHLDTPVADTTAIIFEGEPGDERRLTYRELHREVCQFANVLKSLGIQQGDTVSIYMPMVPEAVIAMLACARIGAVHSVVFAGFSAEALADRNNDVGAKLQITADAGWRRGKQLPLKQTVDAALERSPTVQQCIVLKRVGNEVAMQPGRDVWWHEKMKDAASECPAEELDSEADLFVLYTSGSTGKPKGIRHTTAGYNLFAKKTFEWVFDLQDDDVYWCTADVGWITGHTYVVYGPLSAGATILIYEGAPDFPQKDRWWEIIEKHRVTTFYTAPTAIRACMKWGDDWLRKHDLSSLRLLGTVGEGINPEAWMWYFETVGGERCPIVDTWWQTETGGIALSPLSGAIPAKPGSCTVPLPGIVAEVVDEAGVPVQQGNGGWLVITKPWPGMLRGIRGDDARYREQYWETIPGSYLTGDNARQDEDGYFRIMGRMDDVLNVSGHRLSTIEIESALVSHPNVVEAAVVGRPDPVKGEAVAAFVTIRDAQPSDELRDELRRHVREQIGSLARPDDVRFTDVLPKTRSGKIMRRLLRFVAADQELVGDTSTLEDFSVIDELLSNSDDE